MPWFSPLLAVALLVGGVAASDARAGPTRGAPSAALSGASADRAPSEQQLPALADLDRAARAACDKARDAKRPLLIEFWAPWCDDCQRLGRMERRDPLASELSNWDRFSIDVGSGFEYPELMRNFRVNAIAKLVRVDAASCGAPLASWRAIQSRTLTGLARDEAGAARELARWLVAARKRSPAGPRATAPRSAPPK